MDYTLNAKLKTINYKFDGVVHIGNDDKLPYFVLNYIKKGIDNINKMKNQLGTLSENRVKFLLYDYMQRHKIIKFDDYEITITDTGKMCLDSGKSYNPKYADFSVLLFNDIRTEKYIDIIIEKDKEEHSEDFKVGPYKILCGNENNQSQLNKECIIQGNFLQDNEGVIDAVISNDIIDIDNSNDKETKVNIKYSSKITTKYFKEQIEQKIKDILLEEGLWSEEDDKFIPNIEMLENRKFDLGKQNSEHLLKYRRLEIKNNEDKSFEIYCDTITIKNFQTAPDKNTSDFWFLYELKNKVKDYINQNDLKQIMEGINYELSEKYKLYEAIEYDIDELLDYLVERKEYKLFRYIHACIDLPVEGI